MSDYDHYGGDVVGRCSHLQQQSYGVGVVTLGGHVQRTEPTARAR